MRASAAALSVSVSSVRSFSIGIRSLNAIRAPCAGGVVCDVWTSVGFIGPVPYDAEALRHRGAAVSPAWVGGAAPVCGATASLQSPARSATESSVVVRGDLRSVRSSCCVAVHGDDGPCAFTADTAALGGLRLTRSRVASGTPTGTAGPDSLTRSSPERRRADSTEPPAPAAPQRCHSRTVVRSRCGAEAFGGHSSWPRATLCAWRAPRLPRAHPAPGRW